MSDEPSATTDTARLVQVLRRIQYLLVPATIAALLIAASEVWLVASEYLRSEDEAEPEVKVLVIDQALPSGHMLSLTNVATMKMPFSLLPKGYIEPRDVFVVTGQTLVRPITNLSALSWYDFRVPRLQEPGANP
jgi:Flp pilus assembly protein CpaB